MNYGGRIRIGALASGVAAAALLVGCGGGQNFADQPRPPARLMLSGVITKSGVTVSPSHVGAGPVTIQVSNQTASARTLELDGANIQQPVQSASIAPTDTGNIQITLAPGVYTVKAGSARAVKKELPPARLVIGKARPDSNNQVGLP
jgi:hypothetical protein